MNTGLEDFPRTRKIQKFMDSLSRLVVQRSKSRFKQLKENKNFACCEE